MYSQVFDKYRAPTHARDGWAKIQQPQRNCSQDVAHQEPFCPAHDTRQVRIRVRAVRACMRVCQHWFVLLIQKQHPPSPWSVCCLTSVSLWIISVSMRQHNFPFVYPPAKIFLVSPFIFEYTCHASRYMYFQILQQLADGMFNVNVDKMTQLSALKTQVCCLVKNF